MPSHVCLQLLSVFSPNSGTQDTVMPAWSYRSHKTLESNMSPPDMAHDALATLAQRWRYHRGKSSQLREHKRYAGKGRPTPRTPRKATEGQRQAQVQPDDEAHRYHKQALAALSSPMQR